MNVYQISTDNGSRFQVSALDSDQACWKANRVAADDSILSCRATLDLVEGDSQSTHVRIGQFDLEGHELPSSWSELKEQVSWAREEAVKDAQAHWDYPCHRSRGVFISGKDANGEFLAHVKSKLTQMKIWIIGIRKGRLIWEADLEAAQHNYWCR